MSVGGRSNCKKGGRPCQSEGPNIAKDKGDITCVWMAGVCSLRAGIRSINNVGDGVGNVRDKDMGNGPRKDGRVRGTYPMGTESLRAQRMHKRGTRLNIGDVRTVSPGGKRRVDSSASV